METVMAGQPIKIMIVDDHAIVRQGMKAYLLPRGQFTIRLGKVSSIRPISTRKFPGGANAAPTLIPMLTLAIGAAIVSYPGGDQNS
jgi:hypothetical protein